MVKTYVLTFTGSSVETIGRIEDLIQTDRRTFLSYWNYMPYVFCVKSEASAIELAQKFNRLTSDTFFIAQVQANNINGRLPRAAWEWFNAPPSYSSTPLSDIFKNALKSKD